MEEEAELKAIKERIEKFELRKALKMLGQFYNSQEVTLFKSQLESLEKDNNQGIIPEDNFRAGKAKIAKLILDFIQAKEEEIKGREELFDLSGFGRIDIAPNEESLKGFIQNKFRDEYIILNEIIGSKNHRSIIFKAQLKKQKDVFHAIKLFKAYSLIENENSDEIHFGLDVLKKLSRHQGTIDVVKVDVSSYPWYIIMEYIEGASLRDYFDRGWNWQLEEAIEIVSSIVKSVWNCHQEGVEHGNLRPEKVLLNKNEESKPIISPFRILKSSFFNRRTFDTMLKSCRYLTPEELKGSEINERSDQFSIGLLAFELIIGKPFYEGNSVMEIMKEREEHMNNENFVFEKMNTIPEQISLIIDKLLQSEESERYDDLFEVTKELRKVTIEFEKDFDINLKAIKLSYDRCRKKSFFIEEFYADFFEKFPEARHKFKSVETQHKMLDIAFERLINIKGVDNNSALTSKLQELGKLHKGIEVSQNEVEFFNELLLNKIKKFDSKKWTPILEGYWKEFLTSIVSLMGLKD